jgi:hypothetical protein
MAWLLHSSAARPPYTRESKMKRWLALALLAPIPAQAQGAPAELAIRELSEALKTAAAEATADTAQGRPGRLRFTYEVDRRGDCRVRLTQRARVWKAESQLISDADLTSLSPDLDLWTSPDDGIIIVTAYTTSGQPEIAERWRGTDDDTEHRRDGLRFRGWNRAAVERVAAPLAAAIRACGGRPQDAAARALVARRIDSVAAAARAKTAAQADSLRSIRARMPGPGRWVVDSSPAVKNRRQIWWAVVAASDTVVGRYQATRPVLQLFCGSDTRRVELVVILGQPAELSVNVERRGQKRYMVDRAAVTLQRDEQPARAAGWLYDTKNHRVGPEEGAQLDETLADLLTARRYRVGLRLFDMKEPSHTVFEVDGLARQLEWVRHHCGAKPA